MGAKIQADEISSIIKERIDNFELNVDKDIDLRKYCWDNVIDYDALKEKCQDYKVDWFDWYSCSKCLTDNFIQTVILTHQSSLEEVQSLLCMYFGITEDSKIGVDDARS